MPFPDYSDTRVGEFLDFTGTVAVVTGGAYGIGFAIAKRFCEAGATVVVADIDEPAARAAVDRLGGLKGRATAVRMDASVASEHDAVAARTLSEHGRLDVWVNNAGIYPFTALLELPDEEWHRVIDLNLSGVFYGCRAAGRAMRDAGNGGCIINLSSTAGFRNGGPGLAHYTAAKHGVRGITRNAAAELAQHGIRVLALAPTAISTEGTRASIDIIAAATGVADPFGAFEARLPAGRVGCPDDVARVALFCASKLAGFLTGITIPVDGGDLSV